MSTNWIFVIIIDNFFKLKKPWVFDEKITRPWPWGYWENNTEACGGSVIKTEVQPHGFKFTYWSFTEKKPFIAYLLFFQS